METHEDRVGEVLEFVAPTPLAHRDFDPVMEVPGLVWWQDCPIWEEAGWELSQKLANGWIAA